MGKGIWVASGAVLCGVAFGWGVVAWQGATQSGLPVSAVLPQKSLYWLGARDLRGLVKGVRASDAWSDLKKSGLLDASADGKGLAALSDELADISKKIGYSVDGDNALKFLGDEAAVAVWIDDAKKPHATLATRVDGEALARDLLTGELDWAELHAELNRRAERAELAVTTEEVGDYVISKVTKGETTVYATLLEDLLVVSDTRDGAVAAVNLRVAGGEGSLDRLPVFRDEIARLSAAAPLRDWINVAAVKAAKIAPIERHGRRFHVAQMLDAISAPAVARAIELPENDLYRLGWSWSREGGELFEDNVSPRIRDILPPNALAHVEARRLGQLVDAWDVSPIKAHLEGSWAQKKLAEAIDGAKRDVASHPVLGGQLTLPEMSSDAFATRFGKNFVGQVLGAAFGSDAALAVWRPQAGGQPAVLCAVRLGTDGRMFELLSRIGLEAEGEEQGVVSLEHGTRTIRGRDIVGPPEGVYWVTAGDLLLAANDLDVLKTALDRVDGKSEATDDAVSVAAEGLPEDYRLLITVSPTEYQAAVVDAMNAVSDGGPDDGQIADMLRDAMPYDSAAFAFYVADDLAQVELRYRARLSERGVELSRPARNVARGAPRSFDVLPDGSIGVYASRVDLSAAVRTLREQKLGPFSDVLEKGIHSAEEELGVSLDEAIAPALGDELAVALFYESEALAPELPAVPGVAFLVGVDDRRPIVDLFEKLAAKGREAFGDDPGAPQIVSTMHGDRPEYRIVERQGRHSVPFTPTVTFVDDFLVVSLDSAAVDDMLAVQAGTRQAHSSGDLNTRVRASGLPVDGNEFGHFDWDRLLDQVAVYAPQIAPLFAKHVDVPLPEYPADGDAEEWRRRVQEYHAAEAAQGTGNVDDVIGAIDSLRFVDFIATVSSVESNAFSGQVLVKFRR